MISKIKIKNFRSHNNTEIELSSGVNIICGDNDLGKSTILRALNWVNNNKPSGDSYITHGKNKSIVSIELDNNYVITRIRDRKKGGKNLYYLDKEDISINEFNAVGQNVPEEIKEILKIDDINIQNQQDKTFLLSESSGYISRYLNNLIGLDDIDNSLKNANSEIKRLNTEIKKAEIRKDELDKNRKEYFGLPLQEKKLIYLEKINYDLKNIEEILSSIKKVINSIDELENEINEINYNENLMNKYIVSMEQLSGIDDINFIYGSLTKIINDVENSTSILENINIKNINKKFLKLEKIFYEYDDEEVYTNKLLETINSLDKMFGIRYNLHKEIKDKENELKNTMGDVCPLCEQPIKKEN